MSEAVIAYLHLLTIIVLFSVLTLEHRLFALPLDLWRARNLLRTDIIYGVTAILVVVTGLARVFWFGKGVGYYLANGLFHAKMTLFVLIVLFSFYPTKVFLGWRKSLRAGVVPEVSAQTAKRITWCIRLELLFAMIMPLLAALFARGFGSNY